MHYAAFPSPQLVNIYNLDLRDFELRDKMLRRINRVKRGIAVVQSNIPKEINSCYCIPK